MNFNKKKKKYFNSSIKNINKNILINEDDQNKLSSKTKSSKLLSFF